MRFMTGVLEVSSASSLHQMPESKLTWSRGLPFCAAAPPIASPLANHCLGCTEALEGLQKTLHPNRPGRGMKGGGATLYRLNCHNLKLN